MGEELAGPHFGVNEEEDVTFEPEAKVNRSRTEYESYGFEPDPCQPPPLIPNRQQANKRRKKCQDNEMDLLDETSFADIVEVTRQEKQFLVDEEVMRHVMTFYGLERLLWDSAEEAMPGPDLPADARDLKIDQLMQAVWEEDKVSRRARLEMARTRLMVEIGLDLDDIERQMKVRVDARLKRMNHTPEQRAVRLERERNLMRRKRAEETEEQRQTRLEQGRNHVRLTRALETPEQNAERLQKSREAVKRRREALRRSEGGEEARRRAAEWARERRRQMREAETPEQAEERLARQREQTRRRREKTKKVEC